MATIFCDVQYTQVMGHLPTPESMFLQISFFAGKNGFSGPWPELTSASSLQAWSWRCPKQISAGLTRRPAVRRSSHSYSMKKMPWQWLAMEIKGKISSLYLIYIYIYNYWYIYIYGISITIFDYQGVYGLCMPLSCRKFLGKPQVPLKLQLGEPTLFRGFRLENQQNHLGDSTSLLCFLFC